MSIIHKANLANVIYKGGLFPGVTQIFVVMRVDNCDGLYAECFIQSRTADNIYDARNLIGGITLSRETRKQKDTYGINEFNALGLKIKTMEKAISDRAFRMGKKKKFVIRKPGSMSAYDPTASAYDPTALDGFLNLNVIYEVRRRDYELSDDYLEYVIEEFNNEDIRRSYNHIICDKNCKNLLTYGFETFDSKVLRLSKFSDPEIYIKHTFPKLGIVDVSRENASSIKEAKQYVMSLYKKEDINVDNYSNNELWGSHLHKIITDQIIGDYEI